MKTSDKIKMLVNMSPYHSVVIATMIQNQCSEILKDEAKFLQENKNNVIAPESIIQIAKDCMEKLKQ